MSVPDPDEPKQGSQQDSKINTVELGNITVFGYTIEANLFVALCYLPIPPANIVPCFIALNTPVQNREFFRFNAIQSIILSGGFFAITMLLHIMYGIFGAIPFIGGLINMGLGLVEFAIVAVYLLCSLKLVVSAFQGQTFEVPLLSSYAKKYSNL